MIVGVSAGHFIAWAGGVDYLRTVIDSLLSSPRATGATFHLLIPDLEPRKQSVLHQAKDKLQELMSGGAADAPLTDSAKLNEEAFSEFRGRLTIHHPPNDRRATRQAARKLDLDVVLPAFNSFGMKFPCAWVGYAYDFQYKYFPQLFTPDNCQARDRHFAEMLGEARAVIVNSKSVADDIAKFVPNATAKVFNMPFAPAPNDQWKEDQPEILTRYGLGVPFFLISNQFWAHKDHATAFEAFGSVAAGRPDVSLVCTGTTQDDRDPQYFPKLMETAKKSGLSSRLHVLGLIPKRHQIEIMKHACAVLQPTRFEGGPGGGSVYDSVSLGVPSIVSDLAVNREIEDPSVEFFPAGNAKALAEKMEKRLQTPRTTVSWDSLVASGRRRRAACGDVLWNAVAHAMS